MTSRLTTMTHYQMHKIHLFAHRVGKDSEKKTQRLAWLWNNERGNAKWSEKETTINSLKIILRAWDFLISV